MKATLGDNVERKSKHSNKNDCPIEPPTLKRGEIAATVKAVRNYKGDKGKCYFSICRRKK